MIDTAFIVISGIIVLAMIVLIGAALWIDLSPRRRRER